MVFARQLARRPSNLMIPVFICPRMAEVILVVLFPLAAHGRPQLVTASSQPEVGTGDRLLASLGQPKGM